MPARASKTRVYNRVVEHKKNPAAVALGKLGAQKGGKARMALLSAEERRELARKAARARWAKRVFVASLLVIAALLGIVVLVYRKMDLIRAFWR